MTKDELINKIKSLNEEDLTALQLSKGLTRVDFSWKNHYLTPWCLDNIKENSTYLKFREVFGTTVLLTYAGGDSEYPVSFIIFIDHKGKLRGFIPNAGNSYNKDTKQAFGNDIEADYEYLIDLLKCNEMNYKEYEQSLSEFKEWGEDYSIQIDNWKPLQELTEDDFGCIMSEEAMLNDFRLRVANEE